MKLHRVVYNATRQTNRQTDKQRSNHENITSLVEETKDSAEQALVLYLETIFVIELPIKSVFSLFLQECLPPPTSEAGVRFPTQSQVGMLVVAFLWLTVYSTEPCPTVCTGFLCSPNSPSRYDLHSVKSDVKPQINK